MSLKRIVGIFQIILSMAVVVISFFIYYESNVKNTSNLSPTLSLLLIIFGVLIAIMMFMQGIVNFSQGKKSLNKILDVKKRDVKRAAKDNEETQLEPQEEIRRIGSSVKVLKE